MVQVDDGAVPRAVDENQVTARLQRVEILSLIAQSEGVEGLERYAHSLRGTPQDGVPAVTDTPADDARVTTVALVAVTERGFEDEPATPRAFEPDGEPLELALRLSDGVPLRIEVAGRSRSLPVAPPSRGRPVLAAAVLALLGLAAYAGYAQLL